LAKVNGRTLSAMSCRTQPPRFYKAAVMLVL
jgi:hypothetical protein